MAIRTDKEIAEIFKPAMTPERVDYNHFMREQDQFVLDDLVGKTIEHTRIMSSPLRRSPELGYRHSTVRVVEFEDSSMLMTLQFGDRAEKELGTFLYDGSTVKYAWRLFKTVQ